jgi:hypothetical protein
MSKRSYAVSGRSTAVMVGPIELVAIYSASYQPGRLFGPPEDCYEEHYELDIEGIIYQGDEVGHYLSQTAIDGIDEQCEEDFDDWMKEMRNDNH